MNNFIQLNFDAQLDPVKKLHTGTLTCLYQQGKLRYIRNESQEIVRMIYPAVRDENWNTAPYTISDENLIQHEDGFTISYIAHCLMDKILYDIDVTIVGDSNTITFGFNGKSLSDFKSNRIGICVLHPIALTTGNTVVVTKPSGDTYEKIFPVTISPHQPVKDVQKMLWPADGGNLIIEYSGDIFETEDQRNWTDSSFKTYSTPLDIPKPFDIRIGDEVRQSVTVIFEKNTGGTSATLKNELQPAKLEFPGIGFSRGKDRHLTIQELSLLKEIIFDHYRVELDLSSPEWTEHLRSAIKEARELNTKLELFCFFSESYASEAERFISEIDGVHQSIAGILILDKSSNRSDARTYEVIYRTIKNSYPGLKVGYGSNGHFADVNRNLPDTLPLDFVSFGLTPQAHSTDTISLLENLDNQTDNIETLRKHLGNVPIHVSPVTFKGRKPTLFGATGKPADYDERQHMYIGAAWIIKMLRNFSGTTVTLYDAVGYKGIVTDEHVNGNKPSPVYSLLKQLKTFRPRYFVIGDHPHESEIKLENENGELFRIAFDPMYKEFREYRAIR